jgi:hypothetical protein
MTDATPPANEPAPALPREAAATRIATPEAELAATSTARRQALLLLEIGAEHERLGDAAQAVRQYLAAYNKDGGLRPALEALIDIFEGRRSLSNLARLYKAEVKSAEAPAEKARALVDLAYLRRSVEQARDKALDHAQKALTLAPGDPYVSLAAEHLGRAAGDARGVLAALEARASSARDPSLAALLHLDRAEALEAEGAVDEALSTIERAAEAPATRPRAWRAMERVARRHGAAAQRLRAIEGQAEASAGAGAAGRAAALLEEAGRLRLDALRDAAGAGEALERALALRPDDLALRLGRLRAGRREEDGARAAPETEALLEGLDLGPLRAGLLARLGEQAALEGDAAEAARRFEEAEAGAPGSPVLAARIERSLRAGARSGGPDARRDRARAEVARLLEHARRAEDGALDPRTALEAATLLAHGLGDFAAAEPLYLEAARAGGAAAVALRERYGAAEEAGTRADRVEAIEALLAEPLEADERSALRYELARLLEGDPAATEASARRLEALVLAARDGATSGWGAELLRLAGARSSRWALLEEAHLALAGATDGEDRAAHLAAAARAEVLDGRTDAAIERLEALLAASPQHRYARALLELLLREQGRDEEAAALVEGAASGERRGEPALLLAAARAEAAGQLEAAAAAHRRAMAAAPEATGPAWALYRLGRTAGREDWAREGLERLAELEAAGSTFGTASLLHAEAQALAGPEGRARAAATLAAAPPGDPFDTHAAWLALLLDPSARAVAAALALAEREPGEGKLALTRLAAGAGLTDALDVPAARQAIERLPEAAEDAPLDARDAYLRLRLGAAERRGQGERGADLARPDAILALASALDDPELQAELLLHGLRASLASRGDDATDDAFLWAADLAAMGEARIEATLGREETVSAGDDPDAYADALAARLEREGAAAARTPAELRAAAGRALLGAARFVEARDALRAVLRDDPDDLSSWEALRVAARGAQDFASVREACDRLAEVARGELRAHLLEEAGAACMDALDDDEGAERRFREVLAADPAREVSYGRLHDLLAERGDDVGLLALVEARIERVDEGEELAKLFYEKARLLRSLGRREEALEAIENLLMLDPEHVGGIALAVEIHVTMESYDAAVESLRAIASAQVPAQQKKVARLGAAEFLEKKLGDASGALAELRAIDALGLADGALFARMADLAEASADHEAAVWALERGASLAAGEGGAELARRAALLRLHRLGDAAGAERSLRAALVAAPIDLDVFDTLSGLLDEPRRAELAEGFERSVRARMRPDEVDPELIRRLHRAAIARGDKDFAHVALSTLVAIGVATEAERRTQDENTAIIRKIRPAPTLGDALLERLRAPGDGGPYAELARLAYGALLEADQIEPSRYGVSRSDLVGPKTPHKVHGETVNITQAFGLEPGDFYVGGPRPHLLAAIPAKKGVVHWVAGPAVESPLDTPQRFHAGRQIAGVRARTLPLVNRAPADAAALLHAACRVAGAPLPAGEGRPGVAEWTRALERVMSRKTRKAIAEWAADVRDGGEGALTFCQACRSTALRAGLVISTDLYGSLRIVLGAEPSWQGVQASADAASLVHFWLSTTALELRLELGVAS